MKQEKKVLNMVTTVVVNLQVEGIHNWPAAKEVFPEVCFLSDPHRHMFHIQLKKLVTHSDRDVEFILFKRDVLEYLYKQYYFETHRIHDFGSKSCEMIAAELLQFFDCTFVSVFEDGENGAEVFVHDM